MYCLRDVTLGFQVHHVRYAGIQSRAFEEADTSNSSVGLTVPWQTCIINTPMNHSISLAAKKAILNVID